MRGNRQHPTFAFAILFGAIAAMRVSAADAISSDRTPVLALRLSRVALLDRLAAGRLALLQADRPRPADRHPVRDAVAAFLRVSSFLEHLPGAPDRPEADWIEFLLRRPAVAPNPADAANPAGRPAAWSAVFPVRDPEAYRHALATQTWIEPVEVMGEFEHYRDNAPGRAADLYLARLSGNLIAFGPDRSDLVAARELYEEGPWLAGRLMDGPPGLAIRADPAALASWTAPGSGGSVPATRAFLDRLAIDLALERPADARFRARVRRIAADLADFLEHGLEAVSAGLTLDEAGTLRADLWLRPPESGRAAWAAAPQGPFGLAALLPADVIAWTETHLNEHWLRGAVDYVAVLLRDTAGGFVPPALETSARITLDALIRAGPETLATGLTPVAGRPDLPPVTVRILRWSDPSSALDAAGRLAVFFDPAGDAAEWVRRLGRRWSVNREIPSDVHEAGGEGAIMLTLDMTRDGDAAPFRRERHWLASEGGLWLAAGSPMAGDPAAESAADAARARALRVLRAAARSGRNDSCLSVRAALAATAGGTATMLAGGQVGAFGAAALGGAADWRPLGVGEPTPASRRAAEAWSEALQASGKSDAPCWAYLIFSAAGDARLAATFPGEAVETFCVAAGLGIAR